MKEPRFGKLTTTYFLIFAMVTLAIVGYTVGKFNFWLGVFATFAWGLFCINFVDPWFYFERKRKCTIKSPKSILVAFDSAPIYLIRKGERNIVSLLLEKKNGKNWIYVYESHLNGYDRHLDGLDVNFVDLVAGTFTAKLTDDGFLVEWDTNNWVVLDR